MRLSRPLALLVVALLASPAFAYTIYLKDGSRLVAKSKYEIRGDKAIIILPSGSESMIDFSEIDVERTEIANENNLSATAVVIESGEVKEVKKTAAPPPKKVTLQDMIESNQASFNNAPEQRPKTAVPRAGATARNRGKQGPERVLYPDTGLTTDILGFAAARGVSGLGVYRTDSVKRPLLAFETNSEGSVFKALVVSSNALLHMQNASPGAIDAFEVECETDNGAAAGSFLLTPQLAADLVSGRYEITRFYVENVIF